MTREQAEAAVTVATAERGSMRGKPAATELAAHYRQAILARDEGRRPQ